MNCGLEAVKRLSQDFRPTRGWNQDLNRIFHFNCSVMQVCLSQSHLCSAGLAYVSVFSLLAQWGLVEEERTHSHVWGPACCHLGLERMQPDVSISNQVLYTWGRKNSKSEKRHMQHLLNSRIGRCSGATSVANYWPKQIAKLSQFKGDNDRIYSWYQEISKESQ